MELAEVVWEKNQRLIYKTIWSHISKYGGNFEELLSEAGEAVCRAIRTVDVTRASVETWSINCIRYSLLEHHRQRSNRHYHERPFPESFEGSSSDRTDLELSYSAKKILEVLKREASHDDCPQTIRRILLEHLPTINMVETLTEIRNALS